jgi:hypothetical protein
MSSRFYFTLILCAGVGVFPAQSNAQEGGAIDLRHRLAPPTPGINARPPAVTAAEQAARDRVIQRRLQYRQRRAALRHVARLRHFGQIDFATISKAYHAKKNALSQVATHHHARQQQMSLAKRQALAEVKALATAMRQRFEAEQRAMAEVARKLHEENPDYAEQALRRAAEATEQRTGKAITETETLPLLSKSVNLSYIDPIRRSEKGGDLQSKHLSPIPPAIKPANLPPSPPLMQPNNPATLKEAAELEALIAYKKQKALERAKQASQKAEVSQASISETEKRRKLRELINLYVTEKISPREYYQRRDLILGNSKPAGK